MSTLQDYRSEIDRIDRDILLLIRKRCETAKLLRPLKTETKDENREEVVLNHWRDTADELELNPENAEHIAKLVITEATRAQE